MLLTPDGGLDLGVALGVQSVAAIASQESPTL
jgi:hypothetical protein